MRLFNKVANLLNIQPHEQSLFLWSCLHAFSMGICFVILLNIPMAIFLTRFGGGALPYAFIANAGISLCLGALYSLLERKIKFSSLQTGLLIVINLLAFLIWLGIASSDAKWVVAVLFIIACVLVDYMQLEFWSVLNRIFTLQQAKRFFGFIGGATSIAGICTGFATPLLIRLVGTNQLILIAALIGYISLLALIKIKQYAREKIDTVVSAKETGDEAQASSSLSFCSALKNNYFSLIFLASATAVCSSFVLYVLFNTISEQRFTETAALAKFFAVFYALTDIMRLICNTLVLSPFLRRFGVVITLAILPFIILLIGIIAFITHLIPPIAVYAFWLIAFMQMFASSYGAGVLAPAFLVLFQPLVARERSFIQSKVALIINPLSICLMSLIMIIMGKTIGISMVPCLVFLLILNVLGFCYSLLLKSGYIHALRNALTKIYLIQPELNLVDKNLLPLLQQKLNSPFPDEIVFSLRSLESMDLEEYKKALSTCFDAKDPIIRHYVILEVEKYPVLALFEKIRIIAKNDPSMLVCSAAYQILTHSPEKEDIELALSGLNNPDLTIRCGAILGVFIHLPVYYELALKHLLLMLNSEYAEQRKSAADIIGKSYRLDLSDHLIKLLEDKNLDVRKAAVLAAGELGNSDVLYLAITSENAVLIPQSVIEAIINGASPAFITSLNLNTLSPVAKELIIKSSGYLQSPESLSFLLNNLDSRDNIKVHQVLMALMQRKYLSVESEVSFSIIERLIDDTLDRIKLFKTKMLVIPKNAATDALYGLFKRILWLEQESLLALISFIYGQEDIFEIQMAIESSNEEQYSYALELLDRKLLPKHKDRVIISFETINQKTSTNELLFNELLLDILDPHLTLFSIWITIAAIYYIGNQNKVTLRDKLIPYQQDASEIITETVAWALSQLD